MNDPIPGPRSESFDAFYARAFALFATLLLALALYRIVEPFVGPIVWAIFFAFLLHPLHVRLTRRLGHRPQASASILTVAGTLLLIGPVTGLGIAFAAQAAELLAHVEDVAGEHVTRATELKHLPVIDRTLVWLDDTWGVTSVQLQQWLVQGAQRVLQGMASVGSKLVIGAVGTIVGLGLMIFLLFFFIRDGARMVYAGRKLIPMSESRKEALFEHLSNVTRAVVFGTGMTALIQGSLVGIAFAIVGLKAPLVFGVIAVLFALFPFGGSAFVWIPAAGWLALQHRWGAAIFMIVWGALIVGLVDNFLRPVMISGRAPVATLTVFIGVLGGVAAFGAIGLFLGPVVLALIIALLRFAIELRGENLDTPPEA